LTNTHNAHTYEYYNTLHPPPPPLLAAKARVDHAFEEHNEQDTDADTFKRTFSKKTN
jgi:hypothetical protein